MRRSEKLFVYGTLRRDASNELARFLEQSAVDLGLAEANGLLFQIEEYPGMTIPPGRCKVVFGELYELRDPDATFPILDSYEGCGPNDRPPYEFERKRIRVKAGDGRPVQAWAYIYRGDTSDKREIESGDFLHQANR